MGENNMDVDKYGQEEQYNLEEVLEITEAVNNVIDDPNSFPNSFDFPDYGDLREGLADKLMPDEVDYLQEAIYDAGKENISSEEVIKILVGEN